MRTLKVLRHGAAAAALLALSACATSEPMSVTPAFAEPGSRPAAAPVSGPPAALAAGPACRVRVAALVDGRRAPDVLGVVSGRAVKSPPDVQAWLRSIVGGLQTRGVSPDFDGAASTSPDEVTATITLQSAWVSDLVTNKVANVVLKVQAERPGRPAIAQDYRGHLASINWNGTVGEWQGLVNFAFADALDGMAGDFKRLCA